MTTEATLTTGQTNVLTIETLRDDAVRHAEDIAQRLHALTVPTEATNGSRIAPKILRALETQLRLMDQLVRTLRHTPPDAYLWGRMTLDRFALMERELLSDFSIIAKDPSSPAMP